MALAVGIGIGLRHVRYYLDSEPEQENGFLLMTGDRLLLMSGEPLLLAES